jgi:hypothetical protein
MKNKYASLLFAGFSLAFAGCSSTEITAAQSTPVGSERVLSRMYTTPNKADQRVQIVRDGGLVGSAVDIIISVDGEDIAILQSGEGVELHLPVGRHLITASTKSFGQRGGRDSDDGGRAKPNGSVEGGVHVQRIFHHATLSSIPKQARSGKRAPTVAG